MEETKTEVESPLSPKDSGWTDYVLTLFEEDEKFKGLPKVDGLRRVAELLIGEIVSSRPTYGEMFPGGTSILSNSSAYAAWEYTFKDKVTGESKVFGDMADATPANIEDVNFGKFAMAIAATRAKGRALREALKLKVVAFEEMGSFADALAYAEKKFMTDNQIRALSVFCKRNDINLWMYVNAGKKVYTSLAQVPYDVALIMMKKIDEWQRDNSKIPEKLRGYNEDWKNQMNKE